VLKLQNAGKTDREINQILELCWSGGLSKVAESLGISRWCFKPTVVNKQISIESLKNAFND